MGTLMRNCFEFGPVNKKMLFKDFFLIIAVVAIFLAEQNHFCNFGRGHYGYIPMKLFGPVIQEVVI